ncbi:hypothetical protein ACFLVM_03170 [Chloroflexota bacterium]
MIRNNIYLTVETANNEEKDMSILRGFLSGILGFLLVITLSLLGIAITINATIVNPDFVIDEINNLDVYPIITDQIKAQIPQEESYMTQILDESITELKPWLQDQMAAVINDGYDYLKGGEEPNLVIDLEPVRTSLKANLREYIFESPPSELNDSIIKSLPPELKDAIESLPPELQVVPESLREALLPIAYTEIDELIPPSFELNQDSLGTEIMAPLEQARQVIGYISISDKMLIGLVLLWSLLIALTHWWRVKPICRTIGIAFTTGGLISYLSTLTVSQFAGRAIQANVPIEFQAKLPQLLSDFVAPLQTYGIVVLAVGIGLIVLSIIFKSVAE